MDTIGEFLTRIRNAGMANHEKVDIASSNMRKGIASILKECGYIRDFRVVKDGKQGVMRLYLRYNEKGDHAIRSMRRVSRPSRRVYVKPKEIEIVRNGFGIAILSTNKGILSGKQAHDENVGGEYLCTVW